MEANEILAACPECKSSLRVTVGLQVDGARRPLRVMRSGLRLQRVAPEDAARRRDGEPSDVLLGR